MGRIPPGVRPTGVPSPALSEDGEVTATPATRPRLIATDLDGTLLRSDGTVSARTQAALALAEEAGISIVFVTGRPPRWLESLAEHTGRHGVAICSNGETTPEDAPDKMKEQALRLGSGAPEVAPTGGSGRGNRKESSLLLLCYAAS